MAIDRDAIPLEAEITRQIQRYLAGVPDWWGFKVQGSAQQMRGVPDIVGCYRGLFVAFEIKRPNLGKVSKIQHHMIERIKAAKGHAFVVRSVDDVKQVLDMFASHACEPPGEVGR